LGANDAANIFGTAVGSKMLRFKTAAITCGIFVILGAVISGSGAAKTLDNLGSVNAIAGSFMVTMSAAFTVFWMSKLKLPVSTSQAIVGAIIGWNFFAGFTTDYNCLVKIVLTWAACPVLTAVFTVILYSLAKFAAIRSKTHLLRQDFYVRVSLLVVCAAGAYSLGANNIANVMGVFVSVSPFTDINCFDLFTLSGTQQLFFLGALAIAVGVLTYSKKVIQTVGCGLFSLSAGSSLIIILSSAIVMFMFSSEGLNSWLVSAGLPPLPLVPVSSTQAVVGGVIGIGILKGAKGIRYKALGEIAIGWVATPIIAGIISFVALFFLQNVFKLEVSQKSAQVYSKPAQVCCYKPQSDRLSKPGSDPKIQ